MESIQERKVNYYETDAMGIVHHSNYYRYFEEARIQFLEEMQLPYEALEEMGLMIPVLETHCQYKNPARFADTMQIKTKVAEFKGVRMRISYEVINQKNGEVMAVGETMHCFTDKSLKPINLKKAYPEVYSRFCNK